MRDFFSPSLVPSLSLDLSPPPHPLPGQDPAMTADAEKAMTTAARSAIFFIRPSSSRLETQSQMDFFEILRSAHVSAIDGADLDHFAFLDEERDIDDLAGFEGGGLLNIVRRVAADAFGGFYDLEDD